MTALVDVAIAGGLGAAIAALLTAAANLAARRDSGGDLVDAIDAVLPQIQCAQCGHPGCRPYAQAVAAGAPIDLCPPGGPETVARLAHLLGRDADPIAAPQTLVAVIDEDRCVGCALCLPACPVDAIVGAAEYTHTVLRDHCTGCELCLPPCPVDCISLEPVAVPSWSWPGR